VQDFKAILAHGRAACQNPFFNFSNGSISVKASQVTRCLKAWHANTADLTTSHQPRRPPKTSSNGDVAFVRFDGGPTVITYLTYGARSALRSNDLFGIVAGLKPRC